MEFETLAPIIGVILNISRAGDCCSRMIALRTDNGIVNFTVSPDTLVIDDRQLRVGMRIAAFYDSSLPTPLIFPPQYRAEIIAPLGRNEQAALKFFDRNLVASDRSLQLNLARSTVIRTVNGQSFDCSPANQSLLVYYTMTTRSIPPQTTPSRIVVMC